MNLVVNKDGEPVIITQAGCDGDYFGNLDFIFNEKGVIKPETITNKLQRTIKQSLNPQITDDIKEMKKKYFGEPEILNEISQDINPPNSETEENPITNMLADSVMLKTKTEHKAIPEPEGVLLNSSNVRGGFTAPVITTEDIDEILPFERGPVMTRLSEKNLFLALQHGVDTIKQRSEFIQVAGIKYEIKDGKVTKAFFVDKNNKVKSEIDPNSDKEHVVLIDPFLAEGGGNFGMLKVPEDKVIVRKFDWTYQKSMKEYIKSLTREELQKKLKPQGRITFTGHKNVLKFGTSNLEAVWLKSLKSSQYAKRLRASAGVR